MKRLAAEALGTIVLVIVGYFAGVHVTKNEMYAEAAEQKLNATAQAHLAKEANEKETQELDKRNYEELQNAKNKAIADRDAYRAQLDKLQRDYANRDRVPESEPGSWVDNSCEISGLDRSGVQRYIREHLENIQSRSDNLRAELSQCAIKLSASLEKHEADQKLFTHLSK